MRTHHTACGAILLTVIISFVLIAGTAPIESVQVRNGSRVLRTIRPYGEADLANRIMVVWRGAEVKGRERLSVWDGELRIDGNRILDLTPINFWNPDSQPDRIDDHCVRWRSITTGGLSGLILTLQDARAGLLVMQTVQGAVTCPVDHIGLEPRCWPFAEVVSVPSPARFPAWEAGCQTDVSVAPKTGRRRRPRFRCARQGAR